MSYDMQPNDETGHQSPLRARPGQSDYRSKLNHVCYIRLHKLKVESCMLYKTT